MDQISYKALYRGENKQQKFQGQPLDDELSLNWYGFKWRNHDPQIGRFIQIDPLSDKYVYNSPYAFSENKVTAHIELEGLETLWVLGSTGNIVRGPVIEQAVKPALELGAKTSETVGKVAEAGTKTQEHHLIPRQFKNDPAVELVRDAGFKFEGAENKITVERFSRTTGEGQHGNHPNYNTEISKRLADFKEKNPNATAEQTTQFIRGVAQEMKETIQTNPGTKINDLFKGISPVPVQRRDNTAPSKAPNKQDLRPPDPVNHELETMRRGCT